MSEKDCRNDCATPLRFPRRPGTHFFVGAGEDCFCCDTETKTSADNRPALPHFNYRIGTYASIREFLLHRINHAPNLQNWTHREPDDPAIALLEGAAILGDILTFYQETYANEAFLRTARWRDSIADLTRLLGYRLSPALGGNATFAFEIKKDEAVTIPKGFPVKAALEELEKPAEFETKEEIVAYPRLSRFNLFRPLEQTQISNSTTEFYIHSPSQFTTPIEIKPGDRLIIGESDATGANQPNKLTNEEIVVVDSIRERHGAKIFKIKGKLKRTGSVGSLVAYKLGRAFHHFGYNGADRIVNTSSPITSTSKIINSTTTETSSTVPYLNVPSYRSVSASVNDATVFPTLSNREFPLDAEVTDLPNNIPVVIQGGYIYSGFYYLVGYTPAIETVVRTVSSVKSANVTWGALSASVSVLTVSSSLGNTVGSTASLYIRDTLFHETISPLFVIKKVKTETNASQGGALNFYGTAEQVKNLLDRRLMLEKPNEEPRILSVMSVPTVFQTETLSFPKLHQITVSDEVKYADFPNEKPIVTVYGNLVDADEGKTQPEVVLGSGDNTKIFQTFKLPKSPLTYHIETANTPPETPELDIYVGGRLWQKVETLFGRGADETVYIVREDAENNSWAQFGDGKTGAKLPTGIKNVTAIERVGAGAFGALKADAKVQASAKLKNLDKIWMPQTATGGSEAESGENARDAAPAKAQSLGRIVSLRDYEAEAAAISGASVASAAWRLVENIPAIVITILTETGRSGEHAAIEETLNGYNIGRGANRHPIFVTQGKRMYVRVAVEYALDSTFRADLVEPEIRRALGVNFGEATNKEDRTGLFSLRRRRFGASEYASSIEGAAQNVAGVIWARTTVFAQLSDSDKPAEIVLTTAAGFNPTVPCDATHILSLYDEHLTLTQVAGE